LVINAMEAMPEGGSITITSTFLKAGSRDEPNADRVRITIRDTGTGIPLENLQCIYDPFFTTKENGTGLGLPLSLGIVESHGGRLTVENQIGHGATAYLDLPVIIPEDRKNDT
jgi:two-component system, NtrC family, sensor kinase